MWGNGRGEARTSGLPAEGPAALDGAYQFSLP
jgi:hypothetical protein